MGGERCVLVGVGLLDLRGRRECPRQIGLGGEDLTGSVPTVVSDNDRGATIR